MFFNSSNNLPRVIFIFFKFPLSDDWVMESQVSSVSVKKKKKLVQFILVASERMEKVGKFQSTTVKILL